MFGIIIVIILLVIFIFLLRKALSFSLERLRNEYLILRDELEKKEKSNSEMLAGNRLLEEKSLQTIALYDITRDICKTLDEKAIFSLFRAEIDRYLTLKDCQFIGKEADLRNYSEYVVMPLSIGENIVGYLVASEVAPKDTDKFLILARQFLVGLKRAILFKEVQEMTITDGLTRLFNRRYFSERLEEELSRSKSFSYPLTFLMIDIDRFKDINDHFGHLVGDVILKEIAETVKSGIRLVDFAGRYGGEELAVVLAETNKQQALFASERIRQSVSSRIIKAYDEDLKVTVSIGIASFPEDGLKSGSLIEKADAALYKAKQEGRNRICAA